MDNKEFAEACEKFASLFKRKTEEYKIWTRAAERAKAKLKA